jgi:ferredoxin
MTIFYFTATGNSLDVAKHIGSSSRAGGDGAKLLSIPQLMREGRFAFEDDAVGLVCPVYYLGNPKIVTAFLEKARWQSDYSFAVLTYGGNQIATTYNLQKFMEKREQHFDYMNSIRAVTNYLPKYDLSEAVSALSAKNVEKQIRDIQADIENRQTNTPAASFGQRTIWHVASLAAKKFMNNNMAQKYYFTDEKCTKCGICAKVCPADNIAVGDKVSFGCECEVCLACANLCPQNALHIRGEKSAARYRNPAVALKDILAANGSDHVKEVAQ